MEYIESWIGIHSVSAYSFHYSVHIVAVVATFQDRVQELCSLALGLADVIQIQLT